MARSVKVEKDSRFILAEKYVEETGVSVFLTGKAGTGKTTFLKHIVSSTRKRCAVVAPTGVAAVNAGGVTIHSFFQLPLSPYLPDVKELVTEYQLPEHQRSLKKERIRILRTLELLIIDEISMVRADILDAVDATLKRYRKNTLPFGGVQLLMIGDIQQLPPVVTDAEKPYMEQVYPSPFFFNSKAMRSLRYIVVELEKIHRQSDAVFTSLLNDIRTGRPSQETLELLNRRLDRKFIPPENERWIRLTTHNYQADSVNKARMDALPGEPAVFKAAIDGNYPESAYPADTELCLKAGAQVMFTRNDTSGDARYYNGKIGYLKSVKPHIIVVDEKGDEICVSKERWENIKYEIDPEDNEIKAAVEGSFTQYPLRPAWAITIHKSQGLTFDRVVIDAGSAFSFGQVYVALSRCRTLEGIVLSTPITRNCTFSNLEVAAFEGTYTPENVAEGALCGFRKAFVVDRICESFDLKRLRSLYYKVDKIIADERKNLFSVITSNVLDKADYGRKEVNELADVAVRFQNQIRRIAANPSSDENDRERLMDERIRKAAEYFEGKASGFANGISPLLLLEIGDKEIRAAFRESATAFAKELIFRLTLYRKLIQEDFSAELFSSVKTKCELAPSSTLKALARKLKSMKKL
ncbi:MAG: DEAD/DEAH box helicase [Bacteroidales bacterium]|nr:DEAD/DEAH box helicase [Bacteroidales bacterium]